MAITVWNYQQEYEQEKEEIHAGLEQVFRSGQLILGESVRQFEQEFAAYCDVAYGVGVDNGTNAIMLGLKAIGVKPGEEVITVANTAVPTVSAIVSAGAIPRFVDIDPATYLMDTQQLQEAISPKTSCILPVHLYGQCVNMTAVHTVARQHSLLVLEDCAQAHGALFQGKVAGSMSDAAAFSFYPTKILGAYGDGGMVITDQASVNDKLRRLRFYGMEHVYYAEEHGYNSRLDEIQAEILRRKLRRLDNYIARRRQLASQYDQKLAGSGLILPEVGAGNDHAYYLYVVRHEQRDYVINRLQEQDIFVNISYPWPIHTMRGYADLGYREGDLPRAEAAAKEIFSLPMYPTLTDDEQDIVCEALHKIMKDL